MDGCILPVSPFTGWPVNTSSHFWSWSITWWLRGGKRRLKKSSRTWLKPEAVLELLPVTHRHHLTVAPSSSSLITFWLDLSSSPALLFSRRQFSCCSCNFALDSLALAHKVFNVVQPPQMIWIHDLVPHFPQACVVLTGGRMILLLKHFWPQERWSVGGQDNLDIYTCLDLAHYYR